MDPALPESDLPATQPPLVLRAGARVFARFTLVRMLGRGGMGVVWLADDDVLGDQVALKFLPDVVRWDEDALATLKTEARNARALTHPNIVRIHDFFADAQAAAISMEFVDGESLATRRARAPGGVLGCDDIIAWLPSLCAALDYSHTVVGVVHRDLKPANILLTRDGRPKIADFGVARTLADSMTRVSSWHPGGTLVYMSPQQQMGETPSPADDIYALGAVLYELLTSKPPFHTGNIVAQIHGRQPESIEGRRRTLAIAAPAVPAAWETTIRGCLAKDPARRPASAGAAADILSGEAKAPAGQPSKSRSRQWRRTALIATATGAVVVAGLVWMTPAQPSVVDPDREHARLAGANEPGAREDVFRITHGRVIPDGDLAGLIRDEFGRAGVQASWEDVKVWADARDQSALSALGLAEIPFAWIRRDGLSSPDGSGYYAVRRSGGAGAATVIDTAGRGQLELTYGDPIPAPVLVRKLTLARAPASQPSPWGFSTNAYGEQSNLAVVVEQEFGTDAVVADWTDVLAWSESFPGAAAPATMLKPGESVWIRFGGRLSAEDGVGRYALTRDAETTSQITLARDAKHSLAVVWAPTNGPLRILARIPAPPAADARPEPILESFRVATEALPGTWAVSGDWIRNHDHAIAARVGEPLVLTRDLPAGLEGIACSVSGNMADVVLGMGHVLSLQATDCYLTEVRLERPAGVATGLRLAVGPPGAPVAVRALAPVFGELEIRVVAADQRLRIEVRSADAATVYFGADFVVEEFQVGELAQLQWRVSCAGGREAWIDRVALRAE